MNIISFSEKGFFFRMLTEIACPLHVNSQAEFIFAEKGEMEIEYENKNYRLKEGEMAIIPPYHTHGFSASGEVLVWVVMFPYNISEDLFKLCDDTPLNDIKFKPSDIMIKYLRTFYRDSHTPDEFAQKGFFNCVISEYIAATGFDMSAEKGGTIIRNVIKYIFDTVHTEDVTMEKIGREVGVSTYEVQKIFKAYIGIPLKDFINNTRIQYATELIHTGEFSITEIAYKSGFGSVRNFNRLFKDFHKMTPSEYKNYCRTIIL